MGLSHSPRITTNGLIAYWDAGNPKSYNGDVSIWYDLSGNEHHAYGDPGAEGSGFDDANFPPWQPADGGRFYFTGVTHGFTVLSNMGSHTALTGEWWCWRTSVSNGAYLLDARNDGGTWWLTNYTSDNINVTEQLTASDPATYQFNSNWWERWIHLVITSNASGSGLWINGEQITDSRLKTSASFDEDLGQYCRIGGRYQSNANVFWRGYFASVKLYNRVLDRAEIENNFNSTRGRFGV